MKSYKENWKKLIGIGVVALAALLVLIGIGMIYHEKVKKERSAVRFLCFRWKKRTGRIISIMLRLSVKIPQTASGRRYTREPKMPGKETRS